MKKNVAVVGYGGQGAWHAGHIMRSDAVSLAGIYDIAEKRVKEAQQQITLF
jgi:predicted dehydrogenase